MDANETRGENPIWRVILVVTLGVALVVILGILAMQIAEFGFYRGPDSAWPVTTSGAGVASAPKVEPAATPSSTVTGAQETTTSPATSAPTASAAAPATTDDSAAAPDAMADSASNSAPAAAADTKPAAVPVAETNEVNALPASTTEPAK